LHFGRMVWVPHLMLGRPSVRFWALLG
jgi:hypothetical protein